MALTDSNLRALENHARRAAKDSPIQITRDEALALLVEVRQTRAELAALKAKQAAGGEATSHGR
jgi:hypothetical protein